MSKFKKVLYRWFPILGLVGLLFFVFLPVLVGKVFLSTGVVYSDLWLFNYPLKHWYRELLLDGKLPFWTSYIGNGFPILGEGQIGAFYPFHLILFWLLPAHLAFNFNVFFHFLMAAIFSYMFGRESLKLSRTASMLVGITYSLSGFYIGFIHQINILMVVSYTPLVFLLVEKLVSTKRWLWFFLLSLTFALEILAGNVEMFYYTILLGGLFLVFNLVFPGSSWAKGKVSLVKPVLFFGLAVLLGVLVSSVSLLPVWEMMQFSSRSEGVAYEAASSTEWPSETLALFVNPRAFDIFQAESGYHPLRGATVNIRALYGYVGLLPLFLAGVSLVWWRKKYVLLFAVFLVLSFMFGFGRSTQFYALLWEVIPGMKYFRHPVKILFFIEFCFAVLAGFGLDIFLGGLQKKIGKKRIVVVGAVLIILVFGDLYFNNVLRLRTLVSAKEWFEVPPAAEFLQEELADRTYRFYTHGTNNLDYQWVRDAEMQMEFQNLLPVDLNMIYELPSNREWVALFLLRQQKLNQQKTNLDSERGVLGLSPTFKKALAIQSVRYLVADLPIEDEDLKLVREIPFSREVDHYAYFAGPSGPETRTVPARATYIYEYDKAYPRVLFATKSRSVSSEEEAFEAILDPDFDPREEVIVEEKVEFDSVNQSGEWEAKIVSDQEEKLEISIETESDGFLVVSDTYYPGWKVSVDGVGANIYRANYKFRAVPIKTGSHKVVFSFEPTNWKIGLWISLGSVVVVLFGLGYTFLTKK